MNTIDIKPAPSRCLPALARLYGVYCDPMTTYCLSISHNDQLPRGLEKKCEKIRVKLKAITKAGWK